MSSQSATIRTATREDIPTIIHLIRELAIYEKEPQAAKATPELIEENIFQKEIAKCLIAEAEVEGKTQPIGLAIYFFSFSTWTARPSLYLEDLFVLEAYRNKGAGKALFRELGRIAKSTNCGRVDWSVLDWNEPSIAFYKQVLGAKPMLGWTGMRLEEEGIERLQTLGL
ncbi:acyl-CoA N-acyltransferase [Microstroma glucosiphilum]|uniref:Acyl-CoA N-acyltransferase n=1 Tax=Pseudomicrostroma glucosiphilum TaxID=1684307 RepID=A0A316UC49_9BASI|nr:acyl-CoA N-acyltransferase [Pseudomicrostroma glucosiphilum]PWN22749.1 acyl-CoA N-acyltransferase [Pseudomicrostroma glucosiphilum]